VTCDDVAETRTGVDDYESMDVDVASGSTGPQRCMLYGSCFVVLVTV